MLSDVLDRAVHVLTVCLSLGLCCHALSACSVYDERKVAALQPTAAAVAADSSSFAGAFAAAALQPAAAATADVSTPNPAEGGECEPLPSDEPCQRLPRLPHAPSLDGLPECGLSLASLAPDTASDMTNGAAPPERTVRYAAAFWDEGLYLYVAVQGLPTTPHAPDQPLFCGDAVELFVDADGVLDPQGSYESTGTMQFVVAAPGAMGVGMEAGKFMQGKPFGPWVSNALKVLSTQDGYAVEALISAADLGLWSWQPMRQLGFDLAVDFAAAGAPLDPICSSARSQRFLKLASEAPPCAGQPWCDTRAFCVPQLAP